MGAAGLLAVAELEVGHDGLVEVEADEDRALAHRLTRVDRQQVDALAWLEAELRRHALDRGGAHGSGDHLRDLLGMPDGGEPGAERPACVRRK